MIGRKHFGLRLTEQNFPRYEIYTGKQKILRSFVLGYFQQQVTTKCYENSSKYYFGPILDLFPQFKANKTCLYR